MSNKFKAIHPKEFAEGERVVTEEHPDKVLFFVKAADMQPKGFVIQLKDLDEKNYWVNHIAKQDDI